MVAQITFKCISIIFVVKAALSLIVSSTLLGCYFYIPWNAFDEVCLQLCLDRRAQPGERYQMLCDASQTLKFNSFMHNKQPFDVSIDVLATVLAPFTDCVGYQDYCCKITLSLLRVPLQSECSA